MSEAVSTSTLTRPPAVRISALVLALQCLALVALSAGLWARIAPSMAGGDLLATAAVLDTLLFVVLFLPLGALGLLAALGLVLRRRGAWLLAMLVQAVIQGAALYFYFGVPTSQVVRTGVVYAVMASAIVVVLYLNSADVRLAFRQTRTPFPGNPEREVSHELPA